MYSRFSDLAGQTPLVDISSLLPKGCNATLLAKCEFQNPTYSLKDRIAKHMLETAKASGRLAPGQTVLCASSGNTGAAVSMYCAVLGHPCVILTSPKCSAEKISMCKAFGSEVRIIASGYDTKAAAIAEAEGFFDFNQYEDPSNPEAHYSTMGPELWEQTRGTITHFVSCGSTGGHLSGVAKYLKEQSPLVRVVLADPEGSILWGRVKKQLEEKAAAEAVGKGAEPTEEKDGRSRSPSQHQQLGPIPAPSTGKLTSKIEGAGKTRITKNTDLSLVDGTIYVPDAQAVRMCHKLARAEGILAGGSSGLNVHAAITVAIDAASARQAAGRSPPVVVAMLCDSGLKYQSKYYNPVWMGEQNIDIDDLEVRAN